MGGCQGPGSFSRSYNGANNTVSNGAYGIARGQAFVDRIGAQVAAKAAAYREAYAQGKELDYNKNGEWGWWEDGENEIEYLPNETGKLVPTVIVPSKFHKASQSGRSGFASAPDPKLGTEFSHWAQVGGVILNFFGGVAEANLSLGNISTHQITDAKNLIKGTAYVGLFLTASDMIFYKLDKGEFAPGSGIDAFFAGLALVPGADIVSGVYGVLSAASFVFNQKSLGQNIDENFIIVGAPGGLIFVPRADGPLFR